MDHGGTWHSAGGLLGRRKSAAPPGRASQRLVQDQGSLGSKWRLRQERAERYGRYGGACRRSVNLCPGAGRGRHPRTATKTSTGRGKPLQVASGFPTAEPGQNRLPLAAEQLRPGAMASAGRSLCFLALLCRPPLGAFLPRMFPETSSTMGHVAELSLFKGC